MNIGVIPARLGSTRFPGKILAPLAGRPVVWHTYHQALKAQYLDKVLVAVDDEQVLQVLRKFDVAAVMTAKTHQSGTDRVAEAVKNMDADIVVNIQGDEPLLNPDVIDCLIETFTDPNVVMATAAERRLRATDLVNPNVVKVFLDHESNAAGFERLVPDATLGGCYRHLGIYAFRKPILMGFVKLPLSPGERQYFLEQLRALENGIPIRVILTNHATYGVDTKEDLEKVAKILAMSDKSDAVRKSLEAK